MTQNAPTPMLIERAYDILKKHRLVKNKADFSHRWLKRSERYFSWLQYDRHPGTTEVLLTLISRLDDAIDGQNSIHERKIQHIKGIREEISAVIENRISV